MLLASLLAGSLIPGAGCGGTGRPATVAAKGKVSYKGAPLPNGTVLFSPSDPAKGKAAQAEIQSDGAFQLSTFEMGDGVIPGDYTVSVVSTVKGSEKIARDQGTGVGGKSAIPAKYNNPKTSGLKASLKAGSPQTDLKFDLTD